VGAVSLIKKGRDSAIRSLAVLPFRNLNSGAPDEYFTDGMTDAVTTELAKLGISKVISETSVAQFKDTKKSVPEIARALEVDAVVEGAVLREGNQVRITVQLIRADTDRHVWAESYERQMTDILALQDEVALGVAHAIKLELSPGKAGQPSSPKPVNSEAYEAYLKGRYFLQKRDDSFFRTGDYFQQAIQLDPGYAPAYAGLAQYYVLLSTAPLPPERMIPKAQALSKAKEYAQKAMQLDPNLADSHASLANLYLMDWNWPDADREFQRAIALAPGLAQSHELYANFLSGIGREAEALAEAQRAVELDPLSITAHNAAALAAFSSDEYDRTIEEGSKILELDVNDGRAYQDLFAGHFMKGMYQEALQDAEKGLVLSHRDPFFLALDTVAQGSVGQKEQAVKLVEEMRADSKMTSVAPYFFAVAFAGMGQQKQAMDALEKAYKTHDAYIVGVQADPMLGPLHANPRFQELVRRMKFPAVSRPAQQ